MGGDVWDPMPSGVDSNGQPIIKMENFCHAIDIDPNDPYAFYNTLSRNLRKVIVRSYCHRKAQLPGTEQNLFKYCWESGDRANAWEALHGMGDFALNSIAIVAERIDALLPEAWPHVKYLKDGYYYGSFGFHCAWSDNAKADAFFTERQKDQAKETVARDRPESAAEHQGNLPLAYALLIDFNAHCWRELGRCGVEGLHFIVATPQGAAQGVDDIHVDFVDVAKARTADGFVDWKDPNTAIHLAQVKLGMGVPPSVFYRSHLIKDLPGYPGTGLTEPTIAALDDRINKVQILPQLEFIRNRGHDRWSSKLTAIVAARDAFSKDYEANATRNTTLAAQGSKGRDAMTQIWQPAKVQVYDALDSLCTEVNVAYAIGGAPPMPKPRWQ